MKGRDPSHRDMLARILLILLTQSIQRNKVVINPKCLVARTYLYYMGIAVQDNEKSADNVSSAQNKTEFPEICLCEWSVANWRQSINLLKLSVTGVCVVHVIFVHRSS